MESRIRLILLAALGLLSPLGCGGEGPQTVIRVEGSDTMVNVAQAWAEQYRKTHPHISLQVLGGGSGVGIASLIDGNCDLANTSRKMKENEIARARANRHGEPMEHVVGYDALAVFVHKDNPLNEISIEELAEIYGERGRITTWSQLLGTSLPNGSDKIVRVNRQNSSGTYDYFRDVVLGAQRDFKLGSVDPSGSKDVVTLISWTPSAIGYSGIGCRTDGVKVLALARCKGQPAIPPTVENAQSGTYPITRPLQIYTVGSPTGHIGEYLDWIRSTDGQKVVLALGYAPIPERNVGARSTGGDRQPQQPAREKPSTEPTRATSTRSAIPVRAVAHKPQ